MKLKTTFLLLSFLIAFSVSSQQVGDIFSGGGLNYKITSLSPNTVLVAKHPNFSGSANIPSMVTYSKVEFTVTSVGYEAFTYCPNLKEVTFPNTLENIEDRAFSGCTGLKRVVIPESVKEIGDYAFYGCTGIDTLFFNATHCERMGGNYNDGHRPGFSILNTVIIGDNVKKLPNYAFAYCENLAVVKLGKSLTDLGYGAFYGCAGIKEVTIPEGITAMSSTFRNCTNLHTIKYNAVDCKSFNTAFGSCDSLKTLYIGDKVRLIPDEAFRGLSKLTHVQFPPSVRTIGRSAFSLTGLSQITIPNTVDTIKRDAFFGVPIKEIVLPDSLEVIGEGAFASCNSLRKVNYHSINASFDVYYASGSLFDNCDGPIEMVIGPKVRMIPASGVFKSDVIRNINYQAVRASSSYQPFEYCNGLTSLTIAEGVEQLPGYLFSRCKGLKTIYFNAIHCEDNEPDQSAISDVPGLSQIVFGDKVKHIPGAALSKAPYITQIALPNSVISIGDYAFGSYTMLQDISLPESLKSIGKGAFSQCKALEEITIPAKLDTLSASLFYNCSKLKKVDMPSSIKSIGSYAFLGCSALEEITIPKEVETIGQFTFSDCAGLSKINWGSALKRIGDYAFSNCSRFYTMTIPETVTEIGLYPFSGCPISKVYYNAVECEKVYMHGIFEDGIQEVHMGGHVKTIPANAFKAQPLLYVRMGPSVETIGKHAFSYSCNFSAIDLLPFIKSVGDSAFYECNKLENIYCYAAEAPQVGQEAFSGVRYNNKLWVCPTSIGFPTVGTRWNNLVIAHDMDMCDGTGITEPVKNRDFVEICVINSDEISIKQIPESIDRLHLYSAYGVLLLSQSIDNTNISLNVGMLPSGIYYLSVGGTVHKVLKP